MKRSLLILIAVVAMCAGMTVVAQDSSSPARQQIEAAMNSHKMVYFGQGNVPTPEAQREVMNLYYYDQFRHSMDPLAPYFMLMSKDASLAMGIGGRVQMQGFYDWNGSMPSAGFIPANIPVAGDPLSPERFGTALNESMLFARVFGRSQKYGTYQVYIEAKFNGLSNAMCLSKAYMIWNDLTFGYAHSTFSDPAAQIPTVDSQGANANIGKKSILVRWMHTIKDHVVVAASLESPASEIPTLAGQYTGASDFAPTAAAFLQYQWEGVAQHVRLSGIVRGLQYRDLVSGRNYKVAGWGAHLSTVFNPFYHVNVYGGFTVGKGIGSLIEDLKVGTNDLIASESTPGRMYAPTNIAWYGGIQYYFSHKLFSTVMFSEVRNLPVHQPAAGNDLYKYGLYATANLFWNPVPRVTFGAEYNLGCRKNFDGERKFVDRASIMLRCSF